MTERGVVSAARSQRLADEAALTLRSQGIDGRAVRRGSGFLVTAPEPDLEHARQVLAAWAEENRPEPEPPPRPEHPFPWTTMTLVFGALSIFFLVTGPRDADSVYFQVGSARASRILLGEWWRTLTALCLHADLGHLAGNVLSGALFLGFAARRLGAGVTLALALAAGGLAGGANALLQGPGHDSVGASTAVFAGVGLLAALAATTRGARERRPYLVGVGAGLALLSMLGTSGEHTDLWAHFFGLVAGFALGVPAALASRGPAPRALQAVAGLAAAALVALAWRLALTAS